MRRKGWRFNKIVSNLVVDINVVAHCKGASRRSAPTMVSKSRYVLSTGNARFSKGAIILLHYWTNKWQIESGVESPRKLPTFSQKVAYFLLEIKPFSRRTKSHLCNKLKTKEMQKRGLFIGFNLINVKKRRAMLINLTFGAPFVVFWVQARSFSKNTRKSVTFWG